MRLLLLAFVTLLFPAAYAQETVPTDSLAPAVLRALSGAWTGELEYADYQSGNRVRLPTTLDIRPSALGETYVYNFVYQDPGYRVESVGLLAYDAESDRVVMVSVEGSGAEAESWTVERITLGGASGAARLVLLRAGEDDDRPALLRETWTVEGPSLRVLKEVRFADTEAFAFRNEMRFTRRP